MRARGPLSVVVAGLVVAAGCSGSGGSAGAEAAPSAPARSPAPHETVDDLAAAAAAPAALAVAWQRPGSAAPAAALTGELTLLAECSDRPRRRALLRTAEGVVELPLGLALPAGATTGATVSVGAGSGCSLVATGSGVSATAVGTRNPALPSPLGARRVALVLVDLEDVAHDPGDAGLAAAALAATSDFFRECSYGRASLDGTVLGPVRIAASSSGNDLDAIASQALAAAGVDASAWDHLVFALPRIPAVSWWGLGTIGGAPSRAWVNGSLAVQVLAHELGHGFGLDHSHGPSGEYGDTADVMGQSVGELSAFQKERLGWLGAAGAPSIATVAQSGVYRLDAYETEVGTKALAVSLGAGAGYLYVEARGALGADQGLALAGPILHVARADDGDSSFLVAAGSGGIALAPGEEYVDPVSGVRVRTDAVDAAGATLTVSLPSSPASGPAPASVSIGGPTGAARLASVAVSAPDGGTFTATGTLTVEADAPVSSGRVHGQLVLSRGQAPTTLAVDLAFSVDASGSVSLEGTLTEPSGAVHALRSTRLSVSAR